MAFPVGRALPADLGVIMETTTFVIYYQSTYDTIFSFMDKAFMTAKYPPPFVLIHAANGDHPNMPIQPSQPLIKENKRMIQQE